MPSLTQLLDVINSNPGQPEMQTADSNLRSPSMLTNANETLGSTTALSSVETSRSATTPSSELPIPIRCHRSDVLSSSTDGNTDKTVNTKSTRSGADFLSNENHSLSRPVHDSDLIPKQPVDTDMTPRYHGHTVTSRSCSQNDHINAVFNSSALPKWFSPNASSIILSNAHPDHVDVTSREMLITTIVDETSGLHVLSTEPDTSAFQLQLTDAILDAAQPEKSEVVLPNILPDNRNADATALESPLDVGSNSVLNNGGTSSASFFSKVPAPSLTRIPTVDLPYVPATTNSQVKPNKELGVFTLDARDSPTSVLLPVTSNFVASSVCQNGNANSNSIVPFAHNQLTGFRQTLEPQQLQTVQATEISRPTDVLQAMDESQLVDIPQPANPLQLHECHPTDARTPDIPQGTEVPQNLDIDVDMPSDIDVNSSDFDEYARDLSENQSGHILNSATYRQLKTQPVCTCNSSTRPKLMLFDYLA
jgi:hypothetical protein